MADLHSKFTSVFLIVSFLLSRNWLAFLFPLSTCHSCPSYLVFFMNRQVIALPIFQQADVCARGSACTCPHAFICPSLPLSFSSPSLPFCSWWWCLFGKGSPVTHASLDTTILCSSPLTIQCTTIFFPSLSVIILTKNTLRLPCDKMQTSLPSSLCSAEPVIHRDPPSLKYVSLDSLMPHSDFRVPGWQLFLNLLFNFSNSIRPLDSEDFLIPWAS